MHRYFYSQVCMFMHWCYHVKVHSWFININMYIHAQVYTFMHRYVHSCTCMFMHRNVVRSCAGMEHVHAQMCSCIGTFMHRYVHTEVRSYRGTFMHMYVHAQCTCNLLHRYVHAQGHSYLCPLMYMYKVHTCTWTILMVVSGEIDWAQNGFNW
jgi:hypothetical protein